MRFDRTRLLVGDEGMERLAGATVAIFGLGGVGSYALEAVARAGVGRLILVDADVVESSNINRQLIALENTVGRPKVEVARERVGQINPDARVEAVREFIGPENADRLLGEFHGYAIDAIDSVESKVHLLVALRARAAALVSCMGAGNRCALAPVRVGDISRTTGCPLARQVRQRLRRLGVSTGIRCAYFAEPPAPAAARGPQPSISYVPGMLGLTAAGLIVNDILAAPADSRPGGPVSPDGPHRGGNEA
ncbi:MAG: tRNA threonylcarbamoyladenosine dehydratase [Candidatus Hydrogenedentes bacterium]|nr:tRNA threonylcarbamoyladenosine dehydratase [Candidatus Hydrogenedentota bacterium]